MNNSEMGKFIKVMKALRQPSRVRILKILQHGELCVCEIQAALGMSQGCISKHLEVLNRAGLVDRRKKGFWAYFRLAHAPPSVYGASLLADLKNWLEDDREIADIIEKLPDIRSKDYCRLKRSTGPADDDPVQDPESSRCKGV
ncbi:MAG: ArsR/SmtB family transcription factor [Syntrophales bacterium]